MSEDRTQPASKRRLQMAREHGQVAHSPELTAAGGWLVAVLLLGYWGEGLISGMVGLTREAAGGSVAVSADPAGVVASIRGAAMAVAAPLGVVLAGFACGAIAAHQMQVRGLWAVGLIAPDFGRLWSPGRGGGPAAGAERMAWSAIKAAVLVVVLGGSIRARWGELQALSSLDFPAAAAAAGRAFVGAAEVLAVAMVVLGLADFGLRLARHEALLRTTPEEQREDAKAMEGDPSLRAKRRRLAHAWRGDAPELLAGASLVLAGDDGLTLVLTGGPPPRPVAVAHAARGNTGQALRRSAIAARVPRVEAAGLALRLARLAAAGAPPASPRGAAPVPAEILAELRPLWPAGNG